MWKDRNLSIAYVFHLFMMVVFVIVIARHQTGREQAQIGKIKQKMVGVANTFSVLPGRHVIHKLVKDRELPAEQFQEHYDIASQRLQDVLDANEMGDFELSIIQYDPWKKNLYRLVSSSSMYELGETFYDIDGKLLERYNLGHVELIEHDNGIRKLYAFETLEDEFGGSMGVVRIESDNIDEHLAAKDNSIWFYLMVVAYGLVAAFITPRMLKRRGHVKLERSQEAITKELKRKNKELKMLSMVAKKSKNLMIITDKEGVILWVNETYENKNNFSADELNSFVGKYLPEVSRNENIRNVINNVVKFNEPADYEVESKDEQGNVHYALTTVTPVHDQGGEVVNLLFVDTDITELKLVELENKSFRTFAEKCAAPRIHMKRNGTILFSNSSAEPILRRWMEPGRKNMKPDVAIMLQSICDAGRKESIELRVEDKRFQIDIHPEEKGGEMHILAEEIYSFSSRPTQVDSQDHDLGRAS